MIQTKPCPKCGETAGWWQYKPGSRIVFLPWGDIASQKSDSSDNERKSCANCGNNINDCVEALPGYSFTAIRETIIQKVKAAWRERKQRMIRPQRKPRAPKRPKQ